MDRILHQELSWPPLATPPCHGFHEELFNSRFLCLSWWDSIAVMTGASWFLSVYWRPLLFKVKPSTYHSRKNNVETRPWQQTWSKLMPFCKCYVYQTLGQFLLHIKFKLSGNTSVESCLSGKHPQDRMFCSGNNASFSSDESTRSGLFWSTPGHFTLPGLLLAPSSYLFTSLSSLHDLRKLKNNKSYSNVQGEVEHQIR